MINSIENDPIFDIEANHCAPTGNWDVRSDRRSQEETSDQIHNDRHQEIYLSKLLVDRHNQFFNEGKVGYQIRLERVDSDEINTGDYKDPGDARLEMIQDGKVVRSRVIQIEKKWKLGGMFFTIKEHRLNRCVKQKENIWMIVNRRWMRAITPDELEEIAKRPKKLLTAKYGGKYGWVIEGKIYQDWLDLLTFDPDQAYHRMIDRLLS